MITLASWNDYEHLTNRKFLYTDHPSLSIRGSMAPEVEDNGWVPATVHEIAEMVERMFDQCYKTDEKRSGSSAILQIKWFSFQRQDRRIRYCPNDGISELSN